MDLIEEDEMHVGGEGGRPEKKVVG